MDALFFRHPREQNETYVEHFQAAAEIAVMSGIATAFMAIHAVVPGINLFEIMGTYSETYYGLIVDRLTKRKN